jgi:trehalose 6-phosphate synthase
MIGVDRLGYTKGIPYRLRAFERMLEIAPRFRKQTFLLQIAAPSREIIPEYGELKSELETLSGRINARHAAIDWTPIRYINRIFSQMRLAALYRLSRVGVVTPLCDGMNLVAKEYVAAQSAAEPGVLVLSCFAGAAERLTGALLVNPYDVGGTAKAMQQALEMSIDERRERWSEMITELRAHDIHGWRDEFIRVLLTASRRQGLECRTGKAALVPLAPRTVGESGGATAHGAARVRVPTRATPAAG